MTSPAAGNRTPIRCQWVLFRKRSDFLRASSSTRVICIRIPEVPRIVTEKDCQGCKFWQSASRCES